MKVVQDEADDQESAHAEAAANESYAALFDNPDDPEQVVVGLNDHDTPEARQARHKDRQNRKKLGLLCEQVRAFCKAAGLQAYIFSEGEKPGSTTQSSYCSPEMIKALVQHIAIAHPTLMEQAGEELVAWRKQLEESTIATTHGEETEPGGTEGSGIEEKPIIQVEGYAGPRSAENAGGTGQDDALVTGP